MAGGEYTHILYGQAEALKPTHGGGEYLPD